MKKLVIILIFALCLTFGTLGASGLLKVEVVSNGHMTSTSDAIRIDGGGSVATNTSVTFAQIDPSQAMFAPQGTFSDTYTFESKTDVQVGHTLYMFLNGERWQTDKFDVVFRSDNITYEETFTLYADKASEVEVIVFLHDALDFDEMGQEVGFTIEFYVQ